MADRSDDRGPIGGNGGGYGPRPSAEPDLRTLLSRLGQDLSQLAHDEVTLAKLELRSVADTLSGDVKEAGRALAMDVGKIGVALSLLSLAGLALTAGLIMAIGALLGGAYWAGGLIVGAILAIAAAAFGMSAVKDLKSREALRLVATRRRVGENRDVLKAEARATKEFAREEARDFKRAASPGNAPAAHRALDEPGTRH